MTAIPDALRSRSHTRAYYFCVFAFPPFSITFCAQRTLESHDTQKLRMLVSVKFVIGFISTLLVLAFEISGQKGYGSTVTVNTAHGILAGAIDSSLPIDSFYNVPYAQPPIGGLRLQAPQPILTSFGRLNVWKKTSSQCYGIGANPAPPDPLHAFMLQNGTEDCLKLDIVRPHTRSTGALLPVFVFIHGYASRHTQIQNGQLMSIVASSMLEINLISVAITL